MIDPDWKSEAKKLIRTVDPTVPPIYLLDLREPHIHATGIVGCTSTMYDLMNRDLLKQRGEYQGRGFCAFIGAADIEEGLARTGLKSAKADARRLVLATSLHEFAHDLCSSRTLSESEADEILERSEQARLLISTPIEVDGPDADAEPWLHHTGAPFGRAVAHLLHRANRAGCNFDVHDLWQSQSAYRLSSPLAYLDALEDEPARRIDEPLRAIVASALCPRYETFCNEDLERSRSAHAAGRV